ncbi:MAG: GGDEF domain-containing phosphodiesterase [Pseudomonadota bacterium]
MDALAAKTICRTQLEEWLAAERGAVATVIVTPARLKGVNRIYGHRMGDRIIEAFAERLAIAAPEGAVVTRLSGAKFAVAATVSGPDGAAALAAHLSAAAEGAVDELQMDARVGAVWTGETGTSGASPTEVLSAALMELDRSVERGESGCVAVLDHSRDADELAIARSALGAIRAGRTAIALQPVVDAEGSGRVMFREALIRVFCADGSPMIAGEFMPILNQLGMTLDLDVAVLRLAFDEARRDPALRLSVNLSAASIAHRRWIDVFEDLARRSPDAAERLIIEVTEEAALADRASTSALFNRVRAAGAALALDDFGAGRTSFSQLRDFRFDIVKIDGAFISGVDKSPDNRMLVSALVAIARQFDMMVVAEYVETPSEARVLRALEVDGFQGFLFGRPALVWSNGEAQPIEA